MNGADKLSRQTFLLSEFLENKAADFQLPHLAAKALVHGHCHHKSIMNMTDEERSYKKSAPMSAPVPGCCGMAGSFGFEARKLRPLDGHWRAGLLPAVRKTDDRQASSSPTASVAANRSRN